MRRLRVLSPAVRSIVHGTSGTRLLYITPEKVARSDVLMRALNQLQQQHRLDRVVVDEAHCVSQVRSSRRTLCKHCPAFSCCSSAGAITHAVHYSAAYVLIAYVQ
jgi:hypothetical protein